MQDKDRRRSSAQTSTPYRIAVHRAIPHRATIRAIRITIISEINTTTIKIITDRRIRCRRKCPNSRTITSNLTGAAQSDHRDKHLAPAAMIDRDRDRIHFSKCNNNQPFRGGRISLKGSGSSTIRRIIQWTSRTRPIRHNHPTRRPRIPDRAAARHHPHKKTSILVIMRIRCAPPAPWAPRRAANSAERLESSSCRHLCRVGAARRRRMCIGKAS